MTRSLGYAKVDLEGMRVERGNILLGLTLWRIPGLDEFFSKRLRSALLANGLSFDYGRICRAGYAEDTEKRCPREGHHLSGG